MSWYVRLEQDTYEEAREAFEWDVPADFNVAHDLVQKHDEPEATALYFDHAGGVETYSFGDLDALSNRLAGGLATLGVGRGDRVGVVLPQCPENPLVHLACWKLGAISVPLSVLFGVDALAYRLDDAGAEVVVVDGSVRDTLREAKADLDLADVIEVPEEYVVGAGDPHEESVQADFRHFDDVLAGHPPEREVAEAGPDTPSTIIYTSGSTGPPKGVLHTHDSWPGHHPAFWMYFERDLVDAVCWTPADWAWIGALGDLVFPAWHYGRPVVGSDMSTFEPERAFDILDRFGVTDAFLPPTAVRLMMGIESPTERYDLALEAVCSGGEPLTPEILDWADEKLEGVVVNEIYGQTEANLLVVNCHDWFPANPGSMGKPVPGHEVAVVDTDTGAVCDPGELGEIAVRHGEDPVIFEEYWNNPEATAEARLPAADGGEDWHLTGDMAEVDEEGYVWFKSRADDVIITAGYRVGPGEVESAILEVDAVEQVGVVGLPDDTRGEVIAAYVQPVDGVVGDEALRDSIRETVREHLAKYEYPREIEFVEELPTTTTGKIQRRKLREMELGGV